MNTGPFLLLFFISSYLFIYYIEDIYRKRSKKELEIETYSSICVFIPFLRLDLYESGFFLFRFFCGFWFDCESFWVE